MLIRYFIHTVISKQKQKTAKSIKLLSLAVKYPLIVHFNVIKSFTAKQFLYD